MLFETKGVHNSSLCSNIMGTIIIKVDLKEFIYWHYEVFITEKPTECNHLQVKINEENNITMWSIVPYILTYMWRKFSFHLKKILSLIKCETYFTIRTIQRLSTEIGLKFYLRSTYTQAHSVKLCQLLVFDEKSIWCWTLISLITQTK